MIDSTAWVVAPQTALCRFHIREQSATVGRQAGDRARTGDIQLGRLTLYQLSYTRTGLA